jgi:hypothetical protein
MTTSEQVGQMPSDFVKYVAGEEIQDALFKAVKFDPTHEGEVLEGTDDGIRFAGIIFAVTEGRTPYGMISGQGIVAPEGVRLSVAREGFHPAKADGAITYADATCMGKDGCLKAMPDYDVSPTPDQIVRFAGRAQEDAEDGDTFIVDLDSD